MKLRNNRLKGLSLVMFVVCLFFVVPALCLAEATPDFGRCADIRDDLLRLQCYDEMAGKYQAGAEELEAKELEPNDLDEEELDEEELEFYVVVPSKKLSYLERLWESDSDPFRGKLAIKPHRSSYILPFSYNFSTNSDPIREVYPERDTRDAEAAFQISLKTKIWEDILGRDIDLWFGYTQRSFWQVYSWDDSAPFRETNYEPEILLNMPMDFDLRLMSLKTINFGFNHQSNGRSEPLSRSWNRIVANFGFERNGLFSKDDTLVLELKTWYRIPESDSSDDNPHMYEYFGYGEIWASYFWNKHRFAMMVRNNLESDDNRGALQVEWTFPLNNRIGGYLQYYVGYGESLLDYNHSVNRLGLGFILMDW